PPRPSLVPYTTLFRSVDLLPRLAGLLARLSGALAALFLLEPAFFYILVPAGCVVLVLTVSLRKILKRMHKRIQEAGAAVLAFVRSEEHTSELQSRFDL